MTNENLVGQLAPTEKPQNSPADFAGWQKTIELAVTAEREGLFQAAVDAYVLVLKHVEDAQLNYRCGMCLLTLENWSDAERHFREAIRQDPERIEYHTQLAFTIKKREEIDSIASSQQDPELNAQEEVVDSLKHVHFILDKTINYADSQRQILDTIERCLSDRNPYSESVEVVDNALNVTLFIRQSAEVLLPQNLSDKDYLWQRNSRGKYYVSEFEAVFVPGQWLRNRLLKTKDLGLKPEQVFSVGSPRVDYLRARQENQPKNVSGKLTVLWAPLHNEWKLGKDRALSSHPEFGYYLEVMQEHFEVITVVHPRNRKDKYAIVDELLAADVVISDYSSVLYEAWALGKPVIFPRWLLGDLVLNKAPSSAEAHIYRNKIGYHPQSIVELIEIIRQGPEIGADVHAFMGEYLENYSSGSASKLVVQRLCLLADDMLKDYVRELEQKADLAVKNGQIDSAIANFNELIEIDSGQVLYFDKLAKACKYQSEYKQEIKALESAIRLRRNDANLYYRLAESFEALRQYHKAATSYQKAIQLKGGKSNADLFYRLGYCYEREGIDGPASLRLANEAFERAIQLDQKLDAKRFGIGVFHQARRYWIQAIAAYREKLKEAPLDEHLHYRIATAYSRCHYWQNAEDNYEMAAALKADQAAWHYRLGFVRERQGKYREAAPAYEYAVSLEDKHMPYWYYRLGYVWYKVGEFEKAVRAFSQMILQPDSVLAEDVSKPVIEMEKSDGGYLANEGATTSHLNEYKQEVMGKYLISGLRRLLEEDCSRVDIWCRLGAALEGKEEWQQAVEAYKQAIYRSNEHNKDLHFRLAFVFMQMGDFEQSCQAFIDTQQFQQPHGIKQASVIKDRSMKRLSLYAEFCDNYPLDMGIILYESWFGQRVGCNPYAIFKSFQAEADFESYIHVFVVQNMEDVPVDMKRVKNVVFTKRLSDSYLKYLATAGYLINNSAFPIFFTRREGQKYLNTWHGTPQKKLGKHEDLLKRGNTGRNFVQASHVISPNKHTTHAVLSGYDTLSVLTAKVMESGYPRIDLILNTPQESQRYINSTLAIDHTKPTVLYAPTWRGDRLDPKAAGRERDVVLAIGEFDCNLIFRGHFLAEKQLADMTEMVTFVPSTIDTNELLSVVDVLITDYSSIYLDFIVTKKPVIHYVFDYDEYHESRGLYFGQEEMPGFICKELSELRDALDTSLGILNDFEYTSFISQSYQRCFESYSLLEDGHSGRRVIDFFFRDQGSYKDYSVSEPPAVLVFGGHFVPNEVTEALIGLINEMVDRQIPVTAIIDREAVAASPVNSDLFCSIHSEVTVLGWTPGMALTLEERDALNAYKEQQLAEPMKKIIERVYRREFARNFGNKKWRAIIDFCGEKPFWNMLLANGGDDVIKILYCHFKNGQASKSSFVELFGLLESYRYYDYILVPENGGVNSFLGDSIADEDRFIGIHSTNEYENLLDLFMHDGSRLKDKIN